MKKTPTVKKVFENPIFRDKVTVVKTSEETNGSYSLAELELNPGGGNPLHSHSAFTETFLSVKGKLGVRINNEKFELAPGQSKTVPLNTNHHFFNPTDQTITFQIKFEPGHDNFIKGLAIGYGLAGDKLTNKKGIPKSFTNLALIIELTDTRPAGILGALFPVFRWLAFRAKKNGAEEKLLDRYYYE